MNIATIIPVLQKELDRASAQATVFSPFNIIARTMLGKWRVEACNGHLAFAATYDDTVRVLPVGDHRLFYEAVVDWTTEGKTAVYVPVWLALPMREKGFKVTKMTEEYLMDPARLRELPGGDLRNARYDLTRARAALTSRIEDPRAVFPELLALNDRWYKEAKARLWRPSEKALIVWLIEHWDIVLDLAPRAACAVTRDRAGVVVSFELGCQLSDAYAATFTQRSDREKTKGTTAGANLLTSSTLADHFMCRINDGPAEKQLIARKRKLSLGSMAFYSVERAR